MSGHSKWSTIKHKKAKTDQQKGKVFTRLAKEITVAAKHGGPDPSMNPRLRMAVQKAKEANVPNDNIERAIAKGSGSEGADHLEEMAIEVYAKDGVALIVECMTDNKNRTIPNIKTILNKAGARFANQGSVSYMFKKRGVFVFAPGASEDAVMEVALENQADDVVSEEDGSIEVTVDPHHFETLKQAFDTKKLAYVSSDIVHVADNPVTLDEAQTETLMALIDKLEDDDDVQLVYGNYV